MTLSVGIAQAPEHGVTAEALRHAADKAMYAAKEAGRDCIAVFDDRTITEG